MFTDGLHELRIKFFDRAVFDIETRRASVASAAKFFGNLIDSIFRVFRAEATFDGSSAIFD